MSKSILQKDSERCFLCDSEGNLEEHHIFGGNPGRRLSEHYGLKVKLCKACHNLPPEGAHFNKDTMLRLRQKGQEAFVKTYPTTDFESLFGKNYL